MTLCLDSGLPNRTFADYLDSYDGLVDSVKLGWGTSVVTPKIIEKLKLLQDKNVEVYLGGSLFEVAWKLGKVPEFFALCKELGVKTVEVSDGTFEIPHAEKLMWIEKASQNFKVYSEVGSKDEEKSDQMNSKVWIAQIKAELNAGSSYVITEAREGGTAGICGPNGQLRCTLIEDLVESGINTKRLIFEAPNKVLQTYFIKRFGPDVNLGNIAFQDIVSLETLRCGLRSDTMDMHLK